MSASADPFARIFSTIDALSNVSTYLSELPRVDDPTPDALGRLLDLRQKLGVNSDHLRPVDEAARVFGERVAGPNRRELVADLVADLLRSAEREIQRLIGAGVTDPRLVRTADFSDLRGVTHRLPVPTSQGHDHAVLWCGTIRSLPPGHRLRDLLPAEELYLVAGRGTDSASLVLGLADANWQGPAHGAARPYYLLDDVKRWTKSLAKAQQEKWVEEDKAARREEEERRREWWASPLGRQALRNRLLQEMEEKGRIPEEVVDDPVIRRGLV